MSDIKRAKALLTLINKYDHAYFTENKSLVSDEEYDELYYKLQDLLKDKTIQKSLGRVDMPLGMQQSHLDKITHPMFVGSLDKQKLDDKNLRKKVEKFLNQYDDSKYSLQSKLDGLTLVIYKTEDGHAIVTRGANQKGENVSMQFKDYVELQQAIEKMPPGMVIRGEGVIKSQHFNTVVENQYNQLNDSLDDLRLRPLIIDLDIDLLDSYVNSPIVTDELKADVKDMMDAIKKEWSSTKPVDQDAKLEKQNALNELKFVQQLIKQKDGIYSNARNLASGSVRAKEPNQAYSNQVEFIAYDIMNSASLGITSETETLQMMTDMGFTIAKNQTFTSKDELIDFLCDSTATTNWRENEEFIIDGLVLKPDTKPLNPEYTGHHQKGQLAFKFQPERKETVLRDVTWTLGKTGKLTPVGHFDTVIMGGSKNSQATLSSWGTIEKKGLMIGDTIIVEKANDVIPQIVGPVIEKRTGTEKPIEKPANSYMDGGLLFLSDFEFPLEQQLASFAKSVEIMSAKTATFKKLIDHGFIKTFTDLFTLVDHKEDLYNIKGLGQKSIDTLLDEIELAKNTTLRKVLTSVQLNGIGKSTSDYLVALYPTYADLLTLTDDLIDELPQNEVDVNGKQSLKQIIKRTTILEDLKQFINF